MSKVKHTKGEWVVREDYSNYESTIETSDGIRIAEAKSYGKNIAFRDASKSERVANAKLIAAAPELLEQLIILKNKLFLINDDISGNHYCSFDDEINAANEVIKKTTV